MKSPTLKALSRFNFRRGWVLVALLLTVFLSSAHTRASSPYQELDILFLVDQSGSMGGPKYGGPRSNDPLDLRFEAVQYALETLSQYRRSMLEDTMFRIAVVNFGDTAQIGLGWTAIDTQSQDWDSQQDRLLEQLSPESFGAQNLGNTNFKAAFSLGADLFNQLPDDGFSHLKVIVALTDGAPCAPYDPDWRDPDCNSSQDQVQHMSDLIKFVNENFPPPDYQIYVIAVDAENNYWPKFANQWQSIVGTEGRAERIETSTDVGQSFLRILVDSVRKLRAAPPAGSGEPSDVIGEPIPVVENRTAQIDVPPYYQTLRITVFKVAPETGLTITDPLGNPVTANTDHVTVTGSQSAIEVWTIAFPTPGLWHIITQLDPNLLDIYEDLLRVNWKLETPDGNMPRYVPFDLTLTLTDASGNPLPNYIDPRYALDVKATLQFPSGKTEVVDLQALGTGIYQGRIIPTEVGNYSLGLGATSHTSDGTAFTVLRDTAAQTFEVSPIHLKVEGFPTGNLLVSEPVTLQISLTDENGSNIKPDGLTMTAQVLDQSGQLWADIPLIVQEDGICNGQVTMRDAGQYRVIVQATVPDSNNTPITIDEQTSSLFNVDPANFLLLEIVAPQNGSSQHSTGGAFSSGHTNLVITVRVSKESDGQGVNLSEYTTDPNPLRLDLKNAQGKDFSGKLRLQSTGTPGLYRAVVSNLGNGKFVITLSPKADLELEKSTLFANRTRTITATIMRKTNIWQPLSWDGLILAVVVAILGAAQRAISRIRRRKHPARGELIIIGDDQNNQQDILWRIGLDRFHSNRIVLGRRKLRRLPSELKIKQIVIECKDQRMYDSGRLAVTIRTNKKTNQKTIGRGSEWRIGDTSNVSYYLIKDPDREPSG